MIGGNYLYCPICKRVTWHRKVLFSRWCACIACTTFRYIPFGRLAEWIR